MKPYFSLILFLYVSVLQAECRIDTSMTRYPADGKSSGKIVFRADKHESLTGPFGDISSIVIIAKEKKGREETVYFRSSSEPGNVTFRSDSGCTINLTFYEIGSDIDNDGFPDCAELDSEEDRNAFINWFVRIVESQFVKRNSSWNTSERDCAGLIRYAYRESMKKHDDQWLARNGIGLDKNISDIKKFHYPNVPKMGDKIYKAKTGAAEDASTFDAFADAETLMKYNTRFVSRDLSDAHEGDLLFFRIESKGKIQFHSMIVTSFEKGIHMIVYHTGRGDIIKRVDPSYLKDSGPFVPLSLNDKFLGVYRFHILE